MKELLAGLDMFLHLCAPPGKYRLVRILGFYYIMTRIILTFLAALLVRAREGRRRRDRCAAAMTGRLVLSFFWFAHASSNQAPTFPLVHSSLPLPHHLFHTQLSMLGQLLPPLKPVIRTVLMKGGCVPRDTLTQRYQIPVI
jgi:hypothetical protein